MLACALQALSAALGLAPFVAIAEIGRTLLATPDDAASRVWLIALVAIAALAGRFATLMMVGAITHLADLRFQRDLRKRMALRLSRVPLGWFSQRNAGAVKKALQDDVSTLHHLVGHAYTNTVAAVATPLVALGYIFWTDWRMALAALVPVALGVAGYALQFRGYGANMAQFNQAMEDVNAASVEFVQGIAVIKTFGQAHQAYSRFLVRARAFVDFFWNWMRGLLGFAAATEVVLSPVFSILIVLLIGFGLVSAGMVAPADMLPAVTLAPALTAPFLVMSYASNEIMTAKPAAERVTALLEADVLESPKQGRTPEDARVVYEGVRFSYDGKTDVLSDVDLVLEPGRITALVGPSGSGKSTVARLLPRFWDVNAGVVTIGGVRVSEMAPRTLYAHVGFVFQQVQLIGGTVAENIALGRPDASREEIEAAARAAQIHDRVISLPRGYQSETGADVVFSGGEAQRISIARAILTDAPILVLDEATAFADPDSEAAIQDALSTLIAGRTVLVIAHRLHTIAGVDQICVMDKGRIVECGRHQDLLAQNGLYADLWRASAHDDDRGAVA